MFPKNCDLPSTNKLCVVIFSLIKTDLLILIFPRTFRFSPINVFLLIPISPFMIKAPELIL